MDAIASAADRSTLERAHGELRDAVTSVHNLNQLLRSIRVGPGAVAEAVRDMDATCAPSLISATRDFLRTIEACLGAGATGTLADTISERCKELESALGDPSPLNASRRLTLEHVSSRFIQDLDAVLVLFELLRDATTVAPAPLDLRDLVSQRLPSDTPIPTPSRRIKLSTSFETGSLEVVSNPRALVLLIALSAAFVTLDGDSGCRLSLSRCDGTRTRLLLEPGTRSNDSVELLVPRLLKASKVCARSVARALGSELDWVKDPRAAKLIWSD